jgi:hypothetical protein
MEYEIRFGTAFSIDEFGFVRKGKISIDADTVELSGPKHWSALARFAIFVAIAILPLILFGFAISFILALVIIHYFCASQGSLTFKKADLKEVVRKGRKITFKAPLEPNQQFKKSVFKAATESEAQAIEQSLSGQTSSMLAGI